MNYFLKDKSGNWLNEREDKRVWLKWMELRTHDDLSAIKTPTGYIPRYEDLKKLFSEVLGKEYTKQSYVEQFTIRVPENIRKTERILEIYRKEVRDTPPEVVRVLEEQKQRLVDFEKKYGSYVPPDDLE